MQEAAFVYNMSSIFIMYHVKYILYFHVSFYIYYYFVLTNEITSVDLFILIHALQHANFRQHCTMYIHVIFVVGYSNSVLNIEILYLYVFFLLLMNAPSFRNHIKQLVLARPSQLVLYLQRDVNNNAMQN